MATRMTPYRGCTRVIRCALAAVLAPALAGCLPPTVSLAGKACNTSHACGTDLVCCEGHCQQSCETPRCPDSSCALQRAIDCSAAPQVCLDQCWESCAACAMVCSDVDLKQCLDESSGESWYCRGEEVCLVLVAGSRTADCRVPPPQCTGQPTCDCLEAPWALYPFCSAWEECVDLPGGAIACRSNVQDAGRNDSAGYPDAGVADFGGYDGSTAADRGTAADSSTTADSASADRGIPDAGAFDGAMSDGHSGLDSGIADHGRPDAAGPCGLVAPDCFAAIGTGPTGGRCCETSAQSASCVGTTWHCPADHDYANRCNGFGDFCMDGTTPGCDSGDPCVWAWTGPAGELQCAAFGLSAPCVDGHWICIAGTALRSLCDCVAPDCPG